MIYPPSPLFYPNCHGNLSTSFWSSTWGHWSLSSRGRWERSFQRTWYKDSPHESSNFLPHLHTYRRASTPDQRTLDCLTKNTCKKGLLVNLHKMLFVLRGLCLLFKGQHPAVFHLVPASQNVWLLGQPDEMLRVIRSFAQRFAIFSLGDGKHLMKYIWLHS